MSTTTLHLHVPQLRLGTRLAAGVHGLRAAASTLAKNLSRGAAPDVARDAAEVRALARGYERSQPELAKDLYAAVDRYELNAGL